MAIPFSVPVEPGCIDPSPFGSSGSGSSHPAATITFNPGAATWDSATQTGNIPPGGSAVDNIDSGAGAPTVAPTANVAEQHLWVDTTSNKITHFWNGAAWIAFPESCCPVINTTALAANPPATGNATNLSSFVTGPTGNKYYIDASGDALLLTGAASFPAIVPAPIAADPPATGNTTNLGTVVTGPFGDKFYIDGAGRATLIERALPAAPQPCEATPAKHVMGIDFTAVRPVAYEPYVVITANATPDVKNTENKQFHVDSTATITLDPENWCDGDTAWFTNTTPANTMTLTPVAPSKLAGGTASIALTGAPTRTPLQGEVVKIQYRADTDTFVIQ